MPSKAPVGNRHRQRTSAKEQESLDLAQQAYASRGATLRGISAPAKLVGLGLVVVLSIYRLGPPSAVSASAPATEFSSARAMAHIGFVAREPHPTGSAENETARHYLLDQLTDIGVTPIVQQTGTPDAQNPAAGATQNVVARLKGESSTRAVMLCAHYDSVPNAPGASDDASGVATLLETLRALKSGSPLKNDVIFLFTDGEEAGQVGARVFVAEHPWAKDVGVVLNFEARGTCGPVFMFETSGPNRWLISSFARAARHPVAASYMAEVYKLLPNDTDLGVFKRAGLAGLNFAYVDGSAFYHQPGDDLRHIDERSLQHDGAYALALTREFGQQDLNRIEESGDAIYFDLLGLLLVRYPAWLVGFVSGAIGLLFVGIVAAGVAKRRVTIGGVVKGIFAPVLSAVGVQLLIPTLTALLADGSQSASAAGANGGIAGSSFIFLGVLFLTAAISLAVYLLFAQRIGPRDLYLGVLICWLLLLLAASLYSPGTSYLFAWPLFFGLLPVGFACVSSKPRRDSCGSLLIYWLCAVPALILVVPAIYAIYMGTGLSFAGGLMVLPVLLIGLCVPLVGQLTVKQRWALSCAAGLLALSCFATGLLTAGRDQIPSKPLLIRTPDHNGGGHAQ
jgi:hypothetical protein